METPDILKEITPLADKDCFYIIERYKSEFNFPIHVHSEYELNYVENAKGAQRVVGDSIEEIEDLDMTLITSESLYHSWSNHKCKPATIKEITIQFHPALFKELLCRRQFESINQMFEDAKRGITFSRETIKSITPMLMSLSIEKLGFYSVIRFLSILHELSKDTNYRILSSSSFTGKIDMFDSRRIKLMTEYINANYQNRILITEIAGRVGMSTTAFSRFVKQRTGKSFTDYLIDMRLGYASRALVDTTQSIAEIAYSSGFNNISNFNRIFKNKKRITPKEFREQYKKVKIIV